MGKKKKKRSAIKKKLRRENYKHLKPGMQVVYGHQLYKITALCKHQQLELDGRLQVGVNEVERVNANE